MEITTLKPHFKSMPNDQKKIWLCIIVICLVNWIANFWQISRFGLYLDDYSRIPQAMEATLKSFSDQLTFVFNADLHVRPLHNYLIQGLALVGNTFGGLRGIYIIGYIISTVNTLLLFSLFRRICSQWLFSLIGAMVYCLYPIATIKIWLTSLLGIQPALTFLLVAMHFYFSGFKFISYILMTVSLFCYESIYPVFIAAPFLKQNNNRDSSRELFKHVLISSGIFVGIVGLKFSFLDPRVQQIKYATLLQTILKNMLAGLVFNFRKHLSIPIKNMMVLPRELLVLQLASFGGLLFFFWKIKATDPLFSSSWKQPLTADSAFKKVGGPNYRYAKLLATALLMVMLSYTMSFYGKVYHSSGIASRIHTPAVLGMTLSFATISIAVLSICGRKRTFCFLALIALMFSSLITYNYRIQRNYAASRDLQRCFWSEVVELCPDVEDDTLILVDPNGFPKTFSDISVNWSQSCILEKLFHFPETWQHFPRVYMLTSSPNSTSFSAEKMLSVDSLSELLNNKIISFLKTDDINRKFKMANTIVLTSEGGTLHRRMWLENAHKKRFRLKPRSENRLCRLKHGILYPYLIK